MAIFVANLVGAIVILAWCNHKIKELTDKLKDTDKEGSYLIQKKMDDIPDVLD